MTPCGTLVMMPGTRRHLTESEVVAALRRSSQVEQYLGRFRTNDGRQGIRWLTAFVAGRHFNLVVHEVEDVGSSDLLDVATFPPLDDDEYVGEGRTVASADEPNQILELAVTYGATSTRWVNVGLVQDEYSDDLGGG
jgi:hypothetical protein